MSFRQFGGLNYAAKHNIVASNYNTSNNLLVTQNVGQPHSYINFESDISGTLRVYGEIDLSGNLFVTGDVDICGNLTVGDNISAYSMQVLGPFSTYQDSTSVVPKSYIDTIATGLTPHEECICATTPTSGPSTDGTIILNGLPQTIDGYLVQEYDRVLVKNQGYTTSGYTGSPYNGIWVASTSDWVLADDWSPGTVVYGASTFVRYGTTNNRTTFVQLNECQVDLSGSTPPPAVPTNYSLFGIFGTYGAVAGRGLDYFPNTDILNVDTSLNFINYLDSVAYSSGGPTGASGTLNIGTYTTNDINIGQTGHKINIYSSNVGIGQTATSAYALDVSGNIHIGPSTSLDNGIVFPDGTKQFTAFGTGATGTSQWLYSGNNIYFDSGTVGIGTSTPNSSYALDVSGNGYLSGNQTIGGTLGVTGTSSLYGNVGIGKGPTSTYALDVSGNGYFSGNIEVTDFIELEQKSISISISDSNSIIVAGGAGSSYPISYTTDYGKTWSGSTRSNQLLQSCNSIAWNGVSWIAGGQPVTGGQPIIYSNDGIYWVNSNSTSSYIFSVCNSVTWNGTLWIASGLQPSPNDASGCIGYSSDGIKWNISSSGINCFSGTSSNIYLECSGNLCIAGVSPLGITSNTYFYQSTDGITWSSTAYLTSYIQGGALSSIKYNGDIWLISFTNNPQPDYPIMYSSNPLTTDWSECTYTASSNTKEINIYNIYWTGSIWIASGKNQTNTASDSVARLYESRNGMFWTDLTMNNNSTLWSIDNTDSYINNIISISNDGTTFFFSIKNPFYITSGDLSNNNITLYDNTNTSATSLFPTGMNTICSKFLPTYIASSSSTNILTVTNPLYIQNIPGSYYNYIAISNTALNDYTGENSVNISQNSIGIGKFPGSTYALDVSGNANFSGNVYGPTGIFNNMTINQNETIGGTLGVTGTSALYGNVGIGRGPTGTYALDVSGNVNISNNETIGGTIGVTGTSALYGNVGIGRGPTGTYALDVSGNVNIDASSNYFMNGISISDIYTQKFIMDLCGNLINKIGTFSVQNQIGQSANIKIYIHQNYNADNNEDLIIDIYLKLSNNNTSANGFFANSWYYMYSGVQNNFSNPMPAWTQSNDHTTYSLFILAPGNSNSSYYTISYTPGISTWKNENEFYPSGYPDTSYNSVNGYYSNTPTTFNQDCSFNGTTTAITPSTSDDSGKVATTAWVKNQNYVSNSGSGFASLDGSNNFTGTNTFTNHPITLGATGAWTGTSSYVATIGQVVSQEYLTSADLSSYALLNTTLPQSFTHSLTIASTTAIANTGLTVTNGNLVVTNGNVTASDISANYISASYAITAGTFNSTSDYRIKEDVQPLNNSFVTDNLNPVTYYNKKSKKSDIGFIAHEVQELYPMLVTGEKDGEEMQSINYLGLIPILIKDVQELKKKVKLLEEEIDDLKDELKKKE